MATIYIGLSDLAKAIACAREAVACRPLQDKASAACVNTLSMALALSGSLAEAEPLATSAYKFYKTQDKSTDPELLKQRTDSTLLLYQILSKLNKNTSALSLLNSELKETEQAFACNGAECGRARQPSGEILYRSCTKQTGGRAAQTNQRN